jgi:diguanylate cyclase (GGDEF)-like protein/PAS domain S-box-containing protein
VNRLPINGRLWLLLAVCLGGLGALLAFNLYSEHERIEAVERERLATQSTVIAENLSRQLAAINLALESVIAELPYWAGQPDGRERAIRRLQSMEASMPSVRTFVVLNGEGRVTLSTRTELIGLNVSHREYFLAPLRSLSPDTFFISSPFNTVLGNFVINVTRAIVGPDGKFAGVVSATVDPVDIQILLNSVRYADDMRAMLVHGDGKIFVSQPPLVDVMGKNVSVPGSFFRQHLESKRPISEFKGFDISSGDQRMAVLRTIQPPDLAMDKPLVVSLSRGWSALFAPWLRDVRNTLLAYVLLGLLSSAVMSVYLRQRVQQRRVSQRLQLATEATGVGIWEFDLTTRRYHWDRAMFDLFGLDPQLANALNNDWRQLLLPGERARMKSATRAIIEQGQRFDLIFQIRRPDGQLRSLRSRAALHDEGAGSRTRLIGTTADVTERKMREADLRIAAAAFESQECIFITDAQTVILRVNQAFSSLFGYTAEEALGKTPRILQSGQHDQAFYASLWDRLKNDHVWQGEIWNRRKNGEIFPNWLSISAVRNEEGVVTHYVANHTDITLRKAEEEKINLLAYYDPLTGLPNRRLLHDRLHQAVIRAKRSSGRLALMFLDLDEFKPVNDAFGHQAGDALLTAIAQRLQACVRESDTVARLGGDEFVVLLAGIEVAQDALRVAEKIHAALKQPFTLPGGQQVSISSSAGIAIYPEHGRDESTLTRHADAAMYQAKTAGRDRFVLFQPLAEGPTGETP